MFPQKVLQVTDKPYLAFVTHGGGGKAAESVESIARSFKFKKIQDPILIKGRPDPETEVLLVETGRKLAVVAKTFKRKPAK